MDLPACARAPCRTAADGACLGGQPRSCTVLLRGRHWRRAVHRASAAARLVVCSLPVSERAPLPRKAHQAGVKDVSGRGGKLCVGYSPVAPPSGHGLVP